NNILDVLADVPRLSEGGGVDDGERNRQHTGQGLRQQRLAGAGGADQQDVRLLELDILPGVALVVVNPLVVVVDGHRQLLFRPLLPDHVEIEELLDFLRFGQRAGPLEGPRLVLAILSDDVEADVDAFVTDVDRRSGDQLLDVALALVAEATTQYVAAVALLRHVGMASFSEVAQALFTRESLKSTDTPVTSFQRSLSLRDDLIH